MLHARVALSSSPGPSRNPKKKAKIAAAAGGRKVTSMLDKWAAAGREMASESDEDAELRHPYTKGYLYLSLSLCV